jgi:AbrB family looped-hinge helix DNA binding protein
MPLETSFHDRIQLSVISAITLQALFIRNEPMVSIAQKNLVHDLGRLITMITVRYPEHHYCRYPEILMSLSMVKTKEEEVPPVQATIIEGFARADSRGCITIPAKIREALGLSSGEQVRIAAETSTGMITIHQQVTIDKEQTWFWTADWQKGEHEADKDIAAGRVMKMKSDSMLKEMKNW